MGIIEMMAVLSIFFGTFVGGIYGAASGAFFRSIFGIASNVDISLQGIGHVATTGAVFGFIMGAILGFVLSSTLAGTVFFFAQIERNTRSLLERERSEEPTQYRAAPRF
jgi:membrane associated rhomboid family serine protease